jgi:hypothetical protein
VPLVSLLPVGLIDYQSLTPTVNTIRNIFSSSHRKDLDQIITNVEKHKQQFEDKATLASRKRNEDDHAKILQNVLPVVTVPKVAYPIFNIPFRRNLKFFGREKIMQELHNQLKNVTDDYEPSSSVLHGMGGVGKTQTALEYSYRFRSQYQCIFWLPAEDSVALSRAYCTIGAQIGFFAFGHESHTSQREIEAVYEWLKTTGTYLDVLKVLSLVNVCTRCAKSV